jgi:CubicO group peptidase (beta-lactamase class C family)
MRYRSGVFIMKLFTTISFCMVMLCAGILPLRGTVQAHGDPGGGTERVIAELDLSVPDLMKRHNIPGVSIALIRTARIAWVKGFGVRVSGMPARVDADTVFEAASFSKPVAAFGIMLLAQDRLIGIDDPVQERLPDGFFGNQESGASITPRHLLSHTSGLSNNLLWSNTTIHFAPGSRFSYSGFGYNVLQKYVESITGKKFNDYMDDAVLRRLGMASSGYVYRDAYSVNIARGHSSDPILPCLLAVLAAVITGISGLALYRALPFERMIGDRSRRFAAWMAVSSTLFGASLVVLPVSVTAGVFAGAIWFLSFTLAAVLARTIRTERRSHLLMVTVAGFMVVIAAALFIVPSYRSFPMPEKRFAEARAAASLYTTPRDMARFLIELMEPRMMRKEVLSQMLTPQVRVNAHNSWGLGFGIRHAERDNLVWHWGHMPDFQNFFIADLERKNGIVIMTNSTNGLDAVLEIVRTAMGGEHCCYWEGIPTIFVSL